jgi:hypothetical protein
MLHCCRVNLVALRVSCDIAVMQNRTAQPPMDFTGPKC